MTKSRNNKSFTAAAVAAISAASFFHEMSSKSSLAVICAPLEINENLEKNERRSRRNGRYLRAGGIPTYVESVWAKVDRYGDEKEFFHFTSLTRMSFSKLVEITQPVINKLPVNRDQGQPTTRSLSKRKFNARDIIAMTLKYLTTKSEVKDLHVQFGAIHTSYISYVELGMNAIVNALFGHKDGRVRWDRSKDGLEFASLLYLFVPVPFPSHLKPTL
jgi:hypothetical protein